MVQRPNWLPSILNEDLEALVAAERQWLSQLQVALARFNAQREDREALERSVRQLDELFLLVVVGEFNAGKSAFINALLGQSILEEGVTPTTTRIQQLKYGPEVTHSAVSPTDTKSTVNVVTAPVDLLHEINIVDTPGTNAIHREHETITEEFVPRSDLVLFVTSTDRPFTESERRFLEHIQAWGKKIVVVLNKIDIVEQPEEIRQIETFIMENMRELLGFTPEVYPISAKRALRAKKTQEAELLAASRFEALEAYIADTLDERERIRLKLSNPLGVGLHLIQKYLDVTNNRLDLLSDDLATLDDIERQMQTYRKDMARDFQYRMSDVENVLYDFENRGMAYFDETMRLARVIDLMNKERLKQEFKRDVVADVPQVIEQRTSEAIDWLVSSNLRQWQGVMDHVAERRNVHADRIVGQVGGSFAYDRDKLLATVGRAAKDTIKSYDKEAEARQMAESIQMAVASTALVEVGAIGLGAIVTAIATATWADLTGILAASTVAVLGLFVIPARRRKVKQNLHEKIMAMREQLLRTLRTQFNKELDHSLENIQAAIAPYARFVRTERDYLQETEEELTKIQQWLRKIQAQVDDLKAMA